MFWGRNKCGYISPHIRDSTLGARTITAIVLAGGESRRFGSDKAEAFVDGSTMLERAVRLAGEVADEVVLAGRGYEASPVRGVADDTSLPCGGPPRGVASALRASNGDLIVVLPVDMPYLSRAQLEPLVEAAERAGASSVLLGGGSVAANLLAARRGVLEEAVGLACLKGRLGLRVRMTDFLRASGALLLGAGLLGGAARFIDVDAPGDIGVRVRTRGPLRSVRLSAPDHYARAIELLSSGERRGAARELRLEAASYRADRVWLLEMHALIDSSAVSGRQLARASALASRLRRTGAS